MFFPLNSLCLLAGFAYASYYSDGWKPGQAVHTTAAASDAPAYTPASPQTEPSQHPGPQLGFFDSLLVSGPLSSLLNMAGINITQRLIDAELERANMWDRRIPLITDDNYQELIVDAIPSSTDEIWFVIITTSASKKDTLSAIFDQRFDQAYDLTVAAKDLDHVRWGRIDYFNVTRITTKWNVWRGPWLVVISDRGQTLRFLNTRQIRPQPELMRGWLEHGGHLELPAWKSSFGPGGHREYLLDYLAVVCEKWYRVMTAVPGWVLYIGTGALGTLLVQLLHRGSTQKLQRPQARQEHGKAARRPIQKVESK